MNENGQQGEIIQVVGRFNLRPGAEAAWDANFRERIEAAAAAPGWLGVASWAPVGEPAQRIVVGRWRATEDFDARTQTECYIRTKEILDSCQTSPPDIERFRSVAILDKAPAPG